jgi:hypothetical protein
MKAKTNLKYKPVSPVLKGAQYYNVNAGHFNIF